MVLGHQVKLQIFFTIIYFKSPFFHDDIVQNGQQYRSSEIFGHSVLNNSIPTGIKLYDSVAIWIKFI